MLTEKGGAAIAPPPHNTTKTRIEYPHGTHTPTPLDPPPFFICPLEVFLSPPRLLFPIHLCTYINKKEDAPHGAAAPLRRAPLPLAATAAGNRPPSPAYTDMYTQLRSAQFDDADDADDAEEACTTSGKAAARPPSRSSSSNPAAAAAAKAAASSRALARARRVTRSCSSSSR